MAQSVQKWQSTDGKLYDTQAEALAADKRYEMLSGLKHLVDSQVAYVDAKMLVIDFLVDHEPELRRLFNVGDTAVTRTAVGPRAVA